MQGCSSEIKSRTFAVVACLIPAVASQPQDVLRYAVACALARRARQRNADGNPERVREESGCLGLHEVVQRHPPVQQNWKMAREKSPELTAAELFHFLLEGLLFELLHFVTSPDKLTEPVLTGTKGKDNGKTGNFL